MIPTLSSYARSRIDQTRKKVRSALYAPTPAPEDPAIKKVGPAPLGTDGSGSMSGSGPSPEELAAAKRAAKPALLGTDGSGSVSGSGLSPQELALAQGTVKKPLFSAGGFQTGTGLSPEERSRQGLYQAPPVSQEVQNLKNRIAATPGAKGGIDSKGVGFMTGTGKSPEELAAAQRAAKPAPLGTDGSGSMTGTGKSPEELALAKRAAGGGVTPPPAATSLYGIRKHYSDIATGVNDPLYNIQRNSVAGEIGRDTSAGMNVLKQETAGNKGKSGIYEAGIENFVLERGRVSAEAAAGIESDRVARMEKAWGELSQIEQTQYGRWEKLYNDALDSNDPATAATLWKEGEKNGWTSGAAPAFSETMGPNARILDERGTAATNFTRGQTTYNLGIDIGNPGMILNGLNGMGLQTIDPDSGEARPYNETDVQGILDSMNNEDGGYADSKKGWIATNKAVALTRGYTMNPDGKTMTGPKGEVFKLDEVSGANAEFDLSLSATMPKLPWETNADYLLRLNAWGIEPAAKVPLKKSQVVDADGNTIDTDEDGNSITTDPDGKVIATFTAATVTIGDNGNAVISAASDGSMPTYQKYKNAYTANDETPVLTEAEYAEWITDPNRGTMPEAEWKDNKGFETYKASIPESITHLQDITIDDWRAMDNPASFTATDKTPAQDRTYTAFVESAQGKGDALENMTFDEWLAAGSPVIFDAKKHASGTEINPIIINPEENSATNGSSIGNDGFYWKDGRWEPMQEGKVYKFSGQVATDVGATPMPAGRYVMKQIPQMWIDQTTGEFFDPNVRFNRPGTYMLKVYENLDAVSPAEKFFSVDKNVKWGSDVLFSTGVYYGGDEAISRYRQSLTDGTFLSHQTDLSFYGGVPINNAATT